MCCNIMQYVVSYVMVAVVRDDAMMLEVVVQWCMAWLKNWNWLMMGYNGDWWFWTLKFVVAFDSPQLRIAISVQ